MSIDEYVKALDENGIAYVKNADLSAYCTYKTGGTGKLMVFPKNAEQLKTCAVMARGQNDFRAVTFGAGSNVLFSDDGFDGVLINTTRAAGISVVGASVTAEAGASLAKIREVCAMNCLAGLEFTEGIPATAGGAVAMNAGCFSKCVGDYVSFVITDGGVLNNADCGFSYRNSVFTGGENRTIVSVCFILKPGENDLIEAKRERFKKLRKNQPQGRTCGSVFKNDGFFAGKVIDAANLKGYKIGGARVSEKHANFIIAGAGATSSDIYKLINFVKKRVFETQGVKLEEELGYIGNFND